MNGYQFSLRASHDFNAGMEDNLHIEVATFPASPTTAYERRLGVGFREMHPAQHSGTLDDNP